MTSVRIVPLISDSFHFAAAGLNPVVARLTINVQKPVPDSMTDAFTWQQA